MIFRYHQMSRDTYEKNQPKRVRKSIHRGRRKPAGRTGITEPVEERGFRRKNYNSVIFKKGNLKEQQSTLNLPFWGHWWICWNYSGGFIGIDTQ